MLLHVSTLVFMLTQSNYYTYIEELQLQSLVLFDRDLLFYFILFLLYFTLRSSFLPAFFLSFLPSNLHFFFLSTRLSFSRPFSLLVYFLFPFSFISPFYLRNFFLTSFPFFRCTSSFLYLLFNISPVLLTDSSKPLLYRKHNFSTVTKSQFTNVRTCLPTFPEAEYNSAASYNCFFSVLVIKIINTNLLILKVCYSDTK